MRISAEFLESAFLGVFSHDSPQSVVHDELVEAIRVLPEVEVRNQESRLSMFQPVANAAAIKRNDGFALHHGFYADQPEWFRPNGAEGNHLCALIGAAKVIASAPVHKLDFDIVRCGSF